MSEPAGNPFLDLAAFMALPRLAGLALSTDGNRLVTSVATLNSDRDKWVTALWSIDPDGQAPARRLTRSAPGESNAVFTPTGEILFTSARPDPDAGKDAAEPKPSLWALPADGGEARLLASHPGGINGVSVASEEGTIVFAAATMPGAQTAEADAALLKARKEAGVSAILFEEYPVRQWDHDLGPARTRVFTAGPLDSETGSGGRLADPRDITPQTPATQDVEDIAVSRDGRWLAVAVEVPQDQAARRKRIDLVDIQTGDRRTLADDEGHDYGGMAFSPDGSRLACIRGRHSCWDEPGDSTLWVIDVSTGRGHDLTPEFGNWPAHPVWSGDGTALFFVADEAGHHPLFRVGVQGGAVTRLTARGSLSDLQVHPDGNRLFALRASVDSPAQPIRLDAQQVDQDPPPLPSPGALAGDLPGTLTEVSTVAADGSAVRSWLVLPTGVSAQTPAPLLLWIHGGPLMSWNAWSWRWNPWLMAARGYAVLLPDPALSAGYGQDFVRRGWGAWGAAPYTDLMDSTDAALARDDIDGSRTAAMGGSFGGYMANWIAGHTDRFRAIVTHASLWQLDQFSGTTDSAYYWAREFGDPLHKRQRYEDNSPHHAVAKITTPMLVIHGDKDYRVPIGEGLRLWYDLRRHGVSSRFLYFPDENHWVLKPGNAKVWYDTVFAFLAEHVLDGTWVRPPLL
ncbi:MAG: S9 family peptidase [Geodermatophilaceae bacterium]|nr:S9 family peptidase [Geodermatophilaceae bacterium]